MHWRSTTLFTLVALMILGGTFTTGQDKPALERQPEADRRAIDKLHQNLLQAFDQRDAVAMAANWTEDGEFILNDGEPVRGRAELRKGYAEFFKTVEDGAKVEIITENLRFLSTDTAVSEAMLRLINVDGKTVASCRHSTVLVREDGRWKLAIVREWHRDVGRHVGLHELEWLLGTWRAVTKEREVTITYAWDEHHAFIRGRFTVKEDKSVIDSGMEVIGTDPAEGVLRSWVFQSDGAFASGVWSREGKKWCVDVHGVQADGRKLTATIIYIPLDPHRITWQAVDQTLDGVPVADTAPIKVMKQKAAHKTVAPRSAGNPP